MHAVPGRVAPAFISNKNHRTFFTPNKRNNSSCGPLCSLLSACYANTLILASHRLPARDLLGILLLLNVQDFTDALTNLIKDHVFSPERFCVEERRWILENPTLLVAEDEEAQRVWIIKPVGSVTRPGFYQVSQTTPVGFFSHLKSQKVTKMSNYLLRFLSCFERGGADFQSLVTFLWRDLAFCLWIHLVGSRAAAVYHHHRQLVS